MERVEAGLKLALVRDEAVVGVVVGHGEDPGARVLADQFLVGDGLATGTVALGEVTALAHGVGSRGVEDGRGGDMALGRMALSIWNGRGVVGQKGAALCLGLGV